MEKKVIRAALLGFGTVGTGVYKVLEKQKEEMIPKLGSHPVAYTGVPILAEKSIPA